MAAQTLMGKDFKVTMDRGKFHSIAGAKKFMATVHPSSLLRSRGPDRDAEIAHFIRDLKKLKTFV